MKLTIVEGTTAKKRLQLTDDGEGVNATGLNAPTLYLTDRHGRALQTAGSTEWVTIGSGIFNVLLAALTELTPARGPYRARFELTDAQALKAPYPDTEDGDEWIVVPR